MKKYIQDKILLILIATLLVLPMSIHSFRVYLCKITKHQVCIVINDNAWIKEKIPRGPHDGYAIYHKHIGLK